MNLESFPLQFITNGATPDESILQARQVLDGGCRWVQLRMKDASADVVRSTAERLKVITDQYDATLIIDDHVEVARDVRASGVHLGKNDMHPSQARQILGKEFVIGGTCNTFDDVLRVKDFVDYIGCGPFRFTTTKKNLAPVLGLDGYRDLIWAMRSQGIDTPVVAIGGITVDDIRDVLQSGPNGIALSGEIIRADDPVLKTEQIVDAILHARL